MLYKLLWKGAEQKNSEPWSGFNAFSLHIIPQQSLMPLRGTTIHENRGSILFFRGFDMASEKRFFMKLFSPLERATILAHSSRSIGNLLTYILERMEPLYAT